MDACLLVCVGGQLCLDCFKRLGNCMGISSLARDNWVRRQPPCSARLAALTLQKIRCHLPRRGSEGQRARSAGKPELPSHWPSALGPLTRLGPPRVLQQESVRAALVGASFPDFGLLPALLQEEFCFINGEAAAPPGSLQEKHPYLPAGARPSVKEASLAEKKGNSIWNSW